MYYHDRLSGITDSRKIWKELRNLGICADVRRSRHPFSMDALNDYFGRVAYDPLVPSVSDYLETLPVDEPYRLLFSFRDVTLEEVRSAVCHSVSQARGTDGIPQTIIFKAFPVIGPFLLRIYNDSLRESSFSSCWKSSLVMTINKVSSPREMGDIRPISLLSFMSKVLERLVHQHYYLSTKHLLDAFQTGFRAGHSTQTAILNLTEDIRRNMDRRYVTLLMLFDFSKAFDTVCHVTLLRKLFSLDVSNMVIRWFASYLMDRQQCVIDGDGGASDFVSLNTGVPQGSVLGPLLFSVYINDVASKLQPDVHHIIYTDDLQIYVHFPISQLSTYAALMSAQSAIIAKWATVNHLRLNVSKTKAIIIGSYYYINLLSSLSITEVSMNDTTITFESSVRDLGIWLDSKLNWKEHIKYLCNKSYSLLYRLNYFRKSTTLSLRKHLIQMLLFPLLDYCCLVYSDLSGELGLKLQRVINAGVRYIYGVGRGEHISLYRSSLGWLSTESRRSYFTTTFLYKLFSTCSPTYLYSRYTWNQPVRQLRGVVRPLTIPYAATEYYHRSFTVSSSRLWNGLL